MVDERGARAIPYRDILAVFDDVQFNTQFYKAEWFLQWQVPTFICGGWAYNQASGIRRLEETVQEKITKNKSQRLVISSNTV